MCLSAFCARIAAFISRTPTEVESLPSFNIGVSWVRLIRSSQNCPIQFYLTIVPKSEPKLWEVSFKNDASVAWGQVYETGSESSVSFTEKISEFRYQHQITLSVTPLSCLTSVFEGVKVCVCVYWTIVSPPAPHHPKPGSKGQNERTLTGNMPTTNTSTDWADLKLQKKLKIRQFKCWKLIRGN